MMVRRVQFWRDTPGLPAQARVSRSAFDSAGRAVAEWDPRLGMEPLAPANLATIYSLSGKVLSTVSVDAGLRVSLFAEADQVVQGWDGRGAQRRIEYDALLRTVALFEQARCTERYQYGTAQPAFADRNQCGQLIRHDDPAGTRYFNAFGLTGALLEQTQHFLRDLDSPDWPIPINERNELLEPGEGASTAWCFNSLDERLEQTDAQGNRQRFNQTVDGKLRDSWLHLKNATEPRQMVRAMDYNANGQVERQTSGNGVISLFDYSPTDDRLIRQRALRANHQSLQDLNYRHDPVGNILSIEDKALPIRYFANQRIEPVSRYVYDSLSQLIQATGWEAGSANRGPSHIEDPNAVSNYRQSYRYDAGGNLLELIHQGPQRHGRVLTAAKYSNRCLPEQDGHPPTEAEIAGAFDENGNLLRLEKGRTLSWDARNQLQQVCPVERESELNDTERYIYGGGGMRQRKIRSAHTHAREVISETRYLPGLEIRRVGDDILHVITAQAGRTTVQVMRWESTLPNNLANDQYRCNLADHLGSCALELDREAKVISRETYHPFGSTAFSERGDSNEVSHRTLRYSGKERDATGLYYYGLRYYMPWLQRWTTVDPAGAIDGLNLYCMVSNRPLVFRDADGQVRALPEGVVVKDEHDPQHEVVGAGQANPVKAREPDLPPEMPHPAQSTVSKSATAPPPRWTTLQYLEAHKNSQRTLVVGCGASPQNVTSMGGIRGGACSLGSSHEHDFTVDIDAGANADLTADLVTYRGTDLGRDGLQQFDVISFEYLFRGPRNPFKNEHIQAWIQAADALSRPGAEVFFFNGHAPYREVAAQELRRLNYSVREESSNPGNRRGHVFVVGKKPGSSFFSKISKLF
jgi:insecticidal toxin complex protein TccC